MTEINLLDELNPMCPRACGRTMDDCDEAEDGDCDGGELWRENQKLRAEVQRLTDSEDSRVVLAEAENKRLRAELAVARDRLDDDAWDEPGEKARYCVPCGQLMSPRDVPAHRISDEHKASFDTYHKARLAAEGLSSTDTTPKAVDHG